MILSVAAAAAPILFFGVPWLWYRRSIKDRNSRYHDDGSRGRCWSNGKWEFREMTEQEAEELDRRGVVILARPRVGNAA
jgi:hypothetical protein